MIAYAFRFRDERGHLTGWHGFAFARDKREMFLEIDKYGDPYHAEVRTIRHGSVCYRVEDEDFLEYESDVDDSDRSMWKRPIWPPFNEIHGVTLAEIENARRATTD